jgi:hypothetical protein
VPSLGGPPGAGKSVVVGDLCGALVQPGRRFLDYFEPSTLSILDGEDVVLIDTEMGEAAYVALLEQSGLREGDQLTVIHMDDYGGPASFDLTDPDMFDQMAEVLTSCYECDEGDDAPPSVVIVDNLTAVLQDVGKPLEAYGELHGAFVRLLRSVGTPNGLSVVHNTLEGRHAMGGVTGQNRQAGRWSVWSSNGDDPFAQRYISVKPRWPGRPVPATRLDLGGDGRPHMAEPAYPTPGASSKAATESEAEVYTMQVRERLAEAGPEGLRRAEVTGGGREGKLRREALNALIESGEGVEQDDPSGGRGNPKRCWLAQHSPPQG